jgi:hypothetical protein
MQRPRNEGIKDRGKQEEPILSERLREIATSVEHGTFKETPREWIDLVDTMFKVADQLDEYVKLAEKRRVR